MKYALIFAVMAHQPVVLEYRGDLARPYDPRLARAMSIEEAGQRMRNGNLPVLFAPPGSPVYRGTKEQGQSLLQEWRDAKGDKRRMKAALIYFRNAARNRLRSAKGYVQY